MMNQQYRIAKTKLMQYVRITGLSSRSLGVALAQRVLDERLSEAVGGADATGTLSWTSWGSVKVAARLAPLELKSKVLGDRPPWSGRSLDDGRSITWLEASNARLDGRRIRNCLMHLENPAVRPAQDQHIMERVRVLIAKTPDTLVLAIRVACEHVVAHYVGRALERRRRISRRATLGRGQGRILTELTTAEQVAGRWPWRTCVLGKYPLHATTLLRHHNKDGDII